MSATSDAGWFAYNQSAVCPRCSAEAVRTETRSRAVRSWEWFRDGSRPAKSMMTCSQGHSWSSHSYSANRRLRRLRWWDAIAMNRSVIPTPSSYAIAGLAGLLVGGAANFAIGFKYWWLGGPIAIALAFLSASATAFRGHRRQQTLRHLQDVRDPAGSAMRRQRDHDARLAKRRFPIYGLAEAAHAPSVGGTSYTSDGELLSITVRYRLAGEPGGPEVETQLLKGPDLDPEIATLDEARQAVDFRQWIAFERAAQRGDAFDRLIDRDRSAVELQPARVVVDGVVRAARTARIDAATFMVVRFDALRIIVRSNEQLDAVRLVEIDAPTR